MEIVIASENLHKIREFREILKSLPQIDVRSLLDFPQYALPQTKQKTFKEDATAKAKHAARTLQKWVLADASGIMVPSLGNIPGMQSRFFAGDDATEAENRRKLLIALGGKSDLDRSAYLECCLALANPDGVQKCVSASCEGIITEEERGRNGFGYDAIFRKHDYDKTFAELDEGVKIRISDRRKAFEKLALYLETLPT